MEDVGIDVGSNSNERMFSEWRKISLESEIDREILVFCSDLNRER